MNLPVAISTNPNPYLRFAQLTLYVSTYIVHLHL